MNIDELVLATGNKNKVLEIKELLKGFGINILTLDMFPGMPEVVEDGKTLKDNAIKKAVEIAKKLNKWALADDTGLEVDFLRGAPGVFSARFAGENCTYEDNNEKLIKLLKNVPEKNRGARFRCVIALSDPAGRVKTVDGRIEGSIAQKPEGQNGFGYDPIFYVPAFKKTFAELDAKTKNEISHRGKAMAKAKKLIIKLNK